jgi:hypothetical protein
MDGLRSLIYPEKRLYNILNENSIWTDLYDYVYLENFIKIKRNLYDFNSPCEQCASTMFNDTYYCCIQVLIDSHPEDEYDFKFLDAYSENEYTEESIMTVSLAYAILVLSSHNKEKNVQRFINYTTAFFNNSRYDYIFQHAKNFVKNNKKNMILI